MATDNDRRTYAKADATRARRAHACRRVHRERFGGMGEGVFHEPAARTRSIDAGIEAALDVVARARLEREWKT